MKIAPIILGIVLGFTVTSATAQLIVDAGGTRNLFYAVGGKDKNGLDGFYPYLETASKSAGMTWFGGPAERFGFTLLGADVKVTAVDGLQQLVKFERWPRIQGTLLANKTWATAIDEHHVWLQSLTVRASGLFTEYALFNTNALSGKQFSKPEALGGTLALTYSVAFPSFPGAVALSAGVSADDNYAKLPKVTVGKFVGGSGNQTGISDGTVARLGELNHFHSFPVTLLYSHTFGQVGLSDFLKNFHLLGYHPLDNGTNISYNIIVSPYGSLVPNDETRPTHSIGCNFVLRKFKDSNDIDHPEKGEVSYPVTFFVERQNAFSGKPDTTVGAAVMFHFP